MCFRVTTFDVVLEGELIPIVVSYDEETRAIEIKVDKCKEVALG